MKSGKIMSTMLTALITMFFILAITICIIISVASIYLTNIMKTTETIDIEDIPLKTASNIYEIDPETGTYKIIYRRICNCNDVKMHTELKNLPYYVPEAFISVEDERFYEHMGVDYKRTFAALANEFLNFYGSMNGGSTITQQLIKNITKDNETTWERKVREIFRAIKLERNCTKDEILETYLNTIYFGQNAEGCNMYGIEAAAIGYFGKSASDLTLAEAASLSAVPKNPYYENPVSNFELNQERKNYALRKMFTLGKISPDEYEAAIKEKVLVTNMDEFKNLHPDCLTLSNDEFVNPDISSWTVDTAIYEFKDFVVSKYGYSEQRAIEEFYNGGYDIYITANQNIQNELEKNYADYTFFPEETNEYGEKVQSAFIVIDYYGQILGIVGGIGEKNMSLCWNNATMTHRQPGSTIKPLSVYGYGIENDLITWSTIMQDIPLDAGMVTDEQWPENYNNYWSYKSNTINYFLKKSYNTIPAQLCMDFGTDAVFDFTTKKMHLSLEKSYDADYAPLCVGATHHGSALIDIVSSYIPFGNGGKYYQPHIIEKIIDNVRNKTILEHNISEYEQVIGQDTACIINHMLRNVTDPNQPDDDMGTGVSAHLKNKTLAGKTGTTQNWRDIDFIGLTEDFASGIWIGYPDGENEEAIQNTKSATIWKNVFGNYADNYKSDAHFPESLLVKECSYCSESGLLANPNCPAASQKGFYKNNYNEYCTIH